MLERVAAAGVARDRILLRRHEREGPAGVRTRSLHFPLERQGRFALVAGSVGHGGEVPLRAARADSTARGTTRNLWRLKEAQS